MSLLRGALGPSGSSVPPPTALQSSEWELSTGTVSSGTLDLNPLLLFPLFQPGVKVHPDGRGAYRTMNGQGWSVSCEVLRFSTWPSPTTPKAPTTTSLHG